MLQCERRYQVYICVSAIASTELREPGCFSARGELEDQSCGVIEGTEEDLSIKHSEKHPQA